VAAPFYNRWMLPIGFVLLFLTGVGPMLAWRKATLVNFRDQFMWPAISAVVTAVALAALGVRVWSSGICFALCAFVTGTVVQEFWRGGNVRRRNTGTDIFTAMIGLVGRNKRRYGGYIVHLGIVLIFLGFAGNGFKKDEQVLLKLGQQMTIGKYTLRNDALKVADDGQKQMTTAHIAVFVDGKQVDTLYPAKWAYRKHEQEPTTEVAIRRSLAEDLYIVLAFQAADLATQTATLQIVVNPLVDWIWFGFGVLAIGTGIALLPERAYSFAVAKLPAEAATTTMGLLLALMLAGGTTLSAQAGMPSGPAGENIQASFYARTDFERQLQHEIVCTCGCGHTTIAECRKDPCGTSHEMRGRLAGLIDQGKTHDEIIQAFITSYGSEEMLGAPLDSGFNRLAWLFPYVMGVTGAAAVGFAAIRWTRKPELATDSATPADSGLDDRIDDELRDLD
jgi:cytochrome c-type biogenesis protein CcmF